MGSAFGDEHFGLRLVTRSSHWHDRIYLNINRNYYLAVINTPRISKDLLFYDVSNIKLRSLVKRQV